MPRARLQVLADRDDVDAVLAQVAHRLDDLVVGLAHARDDPRLRQQRPAIGVLGGPDLTCAAKQRERALVVALDPYLRLDPPARLDVVVEDVGPGLEHGAKRALLVAEEVGRQHLDRRLGQLAAERDDRAGPVPGAAVLEVVAIDRGDDDVAQPHARRGSRDLAGLERVERVAALAREHRAVAAGARAGVAHDLERGRAAPEALADVRAARLLAHGVQAVVAQDPLELGVARAGRGHAHAHPRRALVRERAPGHPQAPVSISSNRFPSGSTKPTKRPSSESLTSPNSLIPRATMPPRKRVERRSSRGGPARRPPRRTRARAAACARRPRRAARRRRRAPRSRPRRRPPRARAGRRRSGGSRARSEEKIVMPPRRRHAATAAGSSPSSSSSTSAMRASTGPRASATVNGRPSSRATEVNGTSRPHALNSA